MIHLDRTLEDTVSLGELQQMYASPRPAILAPSLVSFAVVFLAKASFPQTPTEPSPPLTSQG
jgi:hypothetical protein